MAQHPKKYWSVGRRQVALTPLGVVVIGDNDDGTQHTLATGLPGLLGLIETLGEVVEEIKRRRKEDALEKEGK